MVNLLLLVLVATTTFIVLTLYSKEKTQIFVLGLAVSKSVILVMINIFKGQIFIRESLLPVVITAGSLTLTYLLLDYFEKKVQQKNENMLIYY